MTKLSQVDLVGVGLNATDTLIPLPATLCAAPKWSTARKILPGGQVATTVIACQHWGLTTRYVGKLGDEMPPALHHGAFAREGVETQLVTVPGGASPQSLILVDSLANAPSSAGSTTASSFSRTILPRVDR